MNTIFSLLIITIMISACGQGVVDFDNNSYEPKISIDGFLSPGKKVEKIHIFKNYKLGVNPVNNSTLPDVSKTTAWIIDEASGNRYNLSFHPGSSNEDVEGFYWEYTENDLEIGSGKSYTLFVETEIDGKQLATN